MLLKAAPYRGSGAFATGPCAAQNKTGRWRGRFSVRRGGERYFSLPAMSRCFFRFGSVFAAHDFRSGLSPLSE
jgi:hypothetical protein